VIHALAREEDEKLFGSVLLWDHPGTLKKVATR
jgi:hypothetical protein